MQQCVINTFPRTARLHALFRYKNFHLPFPIDQSLSTDKSLPHLWNWRVAYPLSWKFARHKPLFETTRFLESLSGRVNTVLLSVILRSYIVAWVNNGLTLDYSISHGGADPVRVMRVVRLFQNVWLHGLTSDAPPNLLLLSLHFQLIVLLFLQGARRR